MNPEAQIGLLAILCSGFGGALVGWGATRYFMGKVEGLFNKFEVQINTLSETSKDHETRLRELERAV